RAAGNVARAGIRRDPPRPFRRSRRTIQLEADLDPELVCRLADVVHHPNNLAASISWGSLLFDGPLAGAHLPLHVRSELCGRLPGHQRSAGVVAVATEGSAFVRSTIASCARSPRWSRCWLRRWRLAYRSRTHSATGAFQGCCGDGWFFNRLRGLKPSSFAMRTSAGESRQRRAASAHALSSATFCAIDVLDRSLNAKRPACTD